MYQNGRCPPTVISTGRHGRWFVPTPTEPPASQTRVPAGTSSIDAYPVSSPFSSMNGWSAAAGQATVTYHMPSSMGMATAS